MRMIMPSSSAIWKISIRWGYIQAVSYTHLIGTKFAVIREFNMRGCDLVVVPYNMSAEDILAIHPDGVVFSGGPGAVSYTHLDVYKRQE